MRLRDSQEWQFLLTPCIAKRLFCAIARAFLLPYASAILLDSWRRRRGGSPTKVQRNCHTILIKVSRVAVRTMFRNTSLSLQDPAFPQRCAVQFQSRRDTMMICVSLTFVSCG